MCKLLDKEFKITALRNLISIKRQTNKKPPNKQTNKKTPNTQRNHSALYQKNLTEKLKSNRIFELKSPLNIEI
jgi:hypothetical protein